MFVGSGMRRYKLEGNHAAVLNTTKSAFFSSTVGLVRPKTSDKWLKVSHGAGSVFIHDVIVDP